MRDKVALAILELHGTENDMAGELLHMSDRHHAEHGIHHVARDLAGWSREHVRVLAEVGDAHGLSLDPEARTDSSLLAQARQKSSDIVGRRHDPGLLLLRDLRSIHRKAAGVSIDWEVLAQTAQALKDEDLLGVAQQCHPQTLRQLRWADAMIKEISAQVMVTG